jgi:hypothetical protein
MEVTETVCENKTQKDREVFFNRWTPRRRAEDIFGAQRPGGAACCAVPRYKERSIYQIGL